MRKHHVVACLVASLIAAGCGGRESGTSTMSTPLGPTASAGAAPPSGGSSGASAGPTAVRSLETDFMPAAAFPPRNEPFDFRANTLEAKYRDQLRRPAIATFVDIEGSIVWTQEYLRYRLSGCSDADAVQRVIAQIDGRGVQPDCGGAQAGGTVVFPPRNETFAFRSSTLEAKYRDGLRRAATTSFVDIEGDIVWTQEYLRYRVNDCNHATAVQKVIDQIDGRGVQPVCVLPRLVGTYSGPISSTDGPGMMTWTITAQTDSAISGTVTIGQSSTATVSGMVTGTLTATMTATTLTFQVTYTYILSGTQCSGRFGGTVPVTETTIQGNYTGQDCIHSFSGQMSLQRR